MPMIINFSVGKHLRRVTQVLVCLATLLQLTASADEKDEARKALAMLDRSTKARVFHVPNDLIGAGLRDMQDIRDQWRFEITVKCLLSCGRRKDSPLRQMLVDARMQNDHCPIPMNSLVQFMDGQNQILAEIFVHNSGHCFTINGESYLVNSEFDPVSQFQSL